MPNKHDWNARDHYFEIHYKVLRFFEKDMQSPVQYKHQVVTENFEMLIAPKIVFTTWKGTTVHVSLKKDITIRATKLGRREAKRFFFRR